MQLHELQPKYKPKRKKRIGRGGKRGTYSGHGIKGQKSRAGRRFKPIIRELIKRYPKIRGYKFKPLKEKSIILNVKILEKNFQPGDKVTPKILLEKRLICKIKGITPEVKILGEGELKKAIIIEGCQVSKSAREKIEKAGGKINLTTKQFNN